MIARRLLFFPLIELLNFCVNSLPLKLPTMYSIMLFT